MPKKTFDAREFRIEKSLSPPLISTGLLLVLLHLVERANGICSNSY